ncbi:MAG TPA: hypothetical protein VFD44_06570 [Hanamia sp.]|jgi:hypothetical protein|nr:hypothetical protein [Hanamia sp.]
MKRSLFIYYTLLGSATVVFPALRCTNNNYKKLLSQPLFLSHICSASDLREIGKSYLKQTGINAPEQLEKKIMQATNGMSVSTYSSESSINSFLKNKIKMDFISGKTIVIKGWILSETEVQQCALFFLT